MEVSGRLDTLTAPELVARFGEAGKVRIDFSCLDYISSAGLRSLMIILKKVGRENMSVVNLKENVREIFETTGFAELML
jgi:anti-sigma B factor antagonist/stage II sporulation protein AA (anti-sigma F factor antagonist)